MADTPLQSVATAAEAIDRARRIVVKIGSSLLIEKSGAGARHAWLGTLGSDIAALRAQGKQIVVVSSGAVALGREHLGLKRSARLDYRQAAAAAGQALLMQAWERALSTHGIPTAQLLITFEDTEQRKRSLNARATLDVLLAQGGLPVINENDSVATQELRFGDNDRLSARVAQLIRADLLILLSDVDGLYTADPATSPWTEHIPFIGSVTDEISNLAAGARAGGVGSGGMRTKIEAARIASACGCATVIASGREAKPIARLIAGARSTFVAAAGLPGKAYKQWIAGALSPAGTVSIDDGAVAALAAGKSLLPGGVLSVDGDFDRGACLRILDRNGREVARGVSAYGAAEARMIKGRGSARIAELLGYAGPDELVHRGDLVML